MRKEAGVTGFLSGFGHGLTFSPMYEQEQFLKGFWNPDKDQTRSKYMGYNAGKAAGFSILGGLLPYTIESLYHKPKKVMHGLAAAGVGLPLLLGAIYGSLRFNKDKNTIILDNGKAYVWGGKGSKIPSHIKKVISEINKMESRGDTSSPAYIKNQKAVEEWQKSLLSKQGSVKGFLSGFGHGLIFDPRYTGKEIIKGYHGNDEGDTRSKLVGYGMGSMAVPAALNAIIPYLADIGKTKKSKAIISAIAAGLPLTFGALFGNLKYNKARKSVIVDENAAYTWGGKRHKLPPHVAKAIRAARSEAMKGNLTSPEFKENLSIVNKWQKSILR